MLARLWQPVGRLELQTRPVGQTLHQGSGQGGGVLMGVGPLANPGHAGRDAEPEAVAADRKHKIKGEREREETEKRDLGDLKAME